MAAAERDLDIDQGATFFLGFTWYPPGDVDPVTGLPTGSPHDLTGCIARMQIRKRQGQPAIITATSDEVPATEPDRSTAIAAGAGRIRLGGVTGRIEITLTDEDTDILNFRNGRYDLEVEWPIQSGEIRPRVDRVLQGEVNVDVNVTQVDGPDVVIPDGA